jgi:hypothetical protein
MASEVKLNTEAAFKQILKESARKYILITCQHGKLTNKSNSNKAGHTSNP